MCQDLLRRSTSTVGFGAGSNPVLPSGVVQNSCKRRHVPWFSWGCNLQTPSRGLTPPGPPVAGHRGRSVSGRDRGGRSICRHLAGCGDGEKRSRTFDRLDEAVAFQRALMANGFRDP